MKETITRAMIHLGTGLSAVYMAVFALFLLATRIHGPWFRSIQAVGIIGLLVSPLACLLTLGAVVCCLLRNLDIRRRIALLAANALGAAITGWLAVGLLHLWRMGPINPG